jgi:hypothetical protein
MGRTEFRKGGVEGKPYDPNDPQHVAAFYAYQNGSPSNAAKALEQEASLGVPKDRQPIVSQAIDLLKSGKAQKFDPNFDPGKMYQVAIKADPEHFLDWDKPLSEQSEHVRDKLKSLGFTDEPSWRPTYGGGGQDLRTQGGVHLGHIYGVPGEGYYAKLGLGDTPTRFGSRDEAQKWVEQNAQSKGSVGADVHRVLSHSNEANDPVVAEKLREAGIPGIKYLDQGSRLQIDDDIDLVREHVQNAKNRLEMWGKDTPPDHPMRKDLAHWQEQLSLLEGQKPQTRNYAVFDDKLIDILKKYGLAGLAALPAIQAAQQRQAVPLSSLAQ